MGNHRHLHLMNGNRKHSQFLHIYCLQPGPAGRGEVQVKDLFSGEVCSLDIRDVVPIQTTDVLDLLATEDKHERDKKTSNLYEENKALLYSEMQAKIISENFMEGIRTWNEVLQWLRKNQDQIPGIVRCAMLVFLQDFQYDPLDLFRRLTDVLKREEQEGMWWNNQTNLML